MILIPLSLLLIPGLIAVRIHWRGREIVRRSFIYFLWDYFIYTFLIIMLDYGFMFLTNAKRQVSFTLQNIKLDSTIYSAGFVFKYSMAALIFALILPVLVRNRPRLKVTIDDEEEEKDDE